VNNWTAVCAGCVGMTYIYMQPERFPYVQDRILASLQSFIDLYGDDGACTEGLSYWDYGFGYYIYFADLLYKFTDGKMDLIHQEKIRSIAQL